MEDYTCVILITLGSGQVNFAFDPQRLNCLGGSNKIVNNTF